MEYKCVTDEELEAWLAKAPDVLTLVSNREFWGTYTTNHHNTCVTCTEQAMRLIGLGIMQGRPMDEVAPEVIRQVLLCSDAPHIARNLTMRFLMAPHHWTYGEEFSAWVKSATGLCVSCGRPSVGAGCSQSINDECKYEISDRHYWIAFGEPLK